jgi:maleate isomerase
VGLGTPYEEPLGRALADLLVEAGFEPVSLVNLAYTDEEDVVAASDDVVIDLADRARTPDAEAVFLACTNLPTVPLLPGLRERLGVPVLTANQVLIEAALRRAAASAIA